MIGVSLNFVRWLVGLAFTIGGCWLPAQLAAEPVPAVPPANVIAVNLDSALCIHKPVRTFKDLKEEHAVRQKYDFSCGAAALATLLQHYYKLGVNEESVVAFIIHKHGKEEAIRRYQEKKGFSLLDLKTAAASIGFKAVAYSEMTLAELVELNLPAIVPIRTRSFDHFVVFRGLRDDRVFLADPIVGNSTMKAGNFVAAWRNGIGMILKSKEGRTPSDWQPGSTATGFVSQDMTRSYLQSAVIGFQPHVKGQF